MELQRHHAKPHARSPGLHRPQLGDPNSGLGQNVTLTPWGLPLWGLLMTCLGDHSVANVPGGWVPPSLGFGAPHGGRGKLWPERRTFLGCQERPGVQAGGWRRPLQGEGEDSHRQPWTHTQGRLLLLSLSGWSAVRAASALAAGDPHGGEGVPPQHRCESPPPAQRLREETSPMAFSHTRWTDASSRGEAMPFCLLSGGEPPSHHCGVPPRAPHSRPRDM